MHSAPARTPRPQHLTTKHNNPFGPHARRLLALALGSGPSGGRLDFRHEARAAHATLDELGRLLLNVAKVPLRGLSRAGQLA